MIAVLKIIVLFVWLTINKQTINKQTMPTTLSDRPKWIVYFKVYSDPTSCLAHGAKKQDGKKFAFSCASH